MKKEDEIIEAYAVPYITINGKTIYLFTEEDNKKALELVDTVVSTEKEKEQLIGEINKTLYKLSQERFTKD